MGKAVLRALTTALLCGLVSDAAYLQVGSLSFEFISPSVQPHTYYPVSDRQQWELYGMASINKLKKNYLPTYVLTVCIECDDIFENAS